MACFTAYAARPSSPNFQTAYGHWSMSLPAIVPVQYFIPVQYFSTLLNSKVHRRTQSLVFILSKDASTEHQKNESQCVENLRELRSLCCLILALTAATPNQPEPEAMIRLPPRASSFPLSWNGDTKSERNLPLAHSSPPLMERRKFCPLLDLASSRYDLSRSVSMSCHTKDIPLCPSEPTDSWLEPPPGLCRRVPPVPGA
ncbi:hypothetical protein VTK56DRAFT_1722 [Thermocarpiscus australiensis]